MIIDNLPALQVLLPIIGAPVIICLNREKISWFVAALISLLSFIISILLLTKVYKEGIITYNMGNWKGIFGIEYRVDIINSFMLVIVSGIAVFTSIFAKESVKKEIEKEKHPMFYALFLLCFAGLLGILITNDIFNIYVFLEISSLATYALISIGNDRRALLASFEYLVIGTIGATFILISVGILYIMTGSLNITKLYTLVQGIENNIPIKAAMAFLTIGVVMKIAVFPIHLWLVNSYTHAPSFVSSFLSATATKVSVYIIIRIVYSVLGYQFSFFEISLNNMFILFAIVSISTCSIIAIFQTNIKRMLAYSSVSQIGYIILAIGLVSESGNQAVFTHMFAHSLAKCVLFMSVGSFAFIVGSAEIEKMSGVGRHMPITFFVFVIAGLNIIGIPGTVGFISKWYLLNALVEKHLWVILSVVLLSSFMSLIYIFKVVEMLYFKEVKNKDLLIKDPSATMLIPMVSIVVISIVLGFYSAPLTNLTSDISVYLINMNSR